MLWFVASPVLSGFTRYAAGEYMAVFDRGILEMTV